VTWKGRPKHPHNARLRAALLDAARRLAALEAKLGDKARSNRIVQACRRCLESATEEAVRGAPYGAWDCVHQVNDEMLAAMSADELAAQWCSLRAEAEEKLKGSWRAKAAECLVKQAPDGKPPPLEIVRELQGHLATAAQNQQHKLALFEDRTLPSLSVFLGVFVGGVLAFSAIVLNREAMPSFLPWAETLVLGILSGALGGILSTAFSFGQADLTKKIPEVRLGMLVTSMRAVLGAAVAIPVAVFVESEYVKIEGLVKPFSVLALCFLAGFSERWFLGLMERFEAGKK
jgi:cation transporter-like permease